MFIRLFGKKTLSFVDGVGMRYVIFVQGCNHGCPGCQNPDSHDISGGYVSSTEELIHDISTRKFVDGVTFSGGEPFLQQKPLIEIADWCHTHKLNVWSYTGFTYEQLIEKNAEMLKHIDVLVDGKFIESLKSDKCKYRGSTNQRVIKLHDGLKERLMYEVIE